MISLIFWALAAICKAIADNVKDHYYKSIFNNKKIFKSKFWDMVYSNKSQNFIPHTKYKWDIWHLSNSLMIVFFGCAMIFFDKIMVFTLPIKWYAYPIVLFGYGIIFISYFNFFYNYILNKEE